MPISVADPTGGANPAAAAAQSAQGLQQGQAGAAQVTANARELAQQATGQMLQSGGQVLAESGAMARQAQQLGAQSMQKGLGDIQALLKERRMVALDRQREQRALDQQLDKERFATHVEASKGIALAEEAFTDEKGYIDPKNKAKIDEMRAGLAEALKGDNRAQWGPAVGGIFAQIGMASISAKQRMAERGDKANELELEIVGILRQGQRDDDADAAVLNANLGKYQGKDFENELRGKVKGAIADAAKVKGDEVGAAVDAIKAPGISGMRDGAQQYARLLTAPEWDYEAAADLFRTGKVTEREGVMVRSVLKGIGQKTKVVVAGQEVTEPDTLTERVLAGTSGFGAVNARFMDAEVRAAEIRATVPEAYSRRAVRLAADTETAIRKIAKEYGVPEDRVRAAVQADMERKERVKGAPQSAFYPGAKAGPAEQAAGRAVVQTPPPGPSSQQPPEPPTDMSVEPPLDLRSDFLDFDRTPKEQAAAVEAYVEHKVKEVAFGELVGDPALAGMFAKWGEKAKPKLFEATQGQLDEMRGRSKMRLGVSAGLDWAGLGGDVTQLKGRGEASKLAQKLDDRQVGVAMALAAGVRDGKITKASAIREASKIESGAAKADTGGKIKIGGDKAPGLSRFTRLLIDDPKFTDNPAAGLVQEMGSDELLKAVREFKVSQAEGGK